MNARTVLTGFRIIRPKYEQSQDETLRWLAEAHFKAGTKAGGDVKQERMLKLLQRFGCSSKYIGRRGHELSDFTHLDWNRMRIFNLESGSEGIGERTRFFAESVDSIFDRFYCEEREAPGNLIHVTCSGYASPSGAQKLVAARGWSETTRVTHAYHMGCYAAFPALRLARGFVAVGDSGPRADIVHTELCSIHLDPFDHSPEQLVVQSLFADGFIRYSLLDASNANADCSDALWVEALREEIVPETNDYMTWVTSDWGMRMTLARDVPEKINEVILPFLERLAAQSRTSAAELQRRALFAVHPGGPRIIDSIQKSLQLGDEQLSYSRRILFECGNMSSATLPHVWSALASSRSIARGTPIVSLAFGPGLTVCGGIFTKA